MSGVEDNRSASQESIFPDLQAIEARLRALEVRFGVDQAFDRLDRRLDEFNHRAEQCHEVVMMALGRLVDYTEVRERLVRLEKQQHAH